MNPKLRPQTELHIALEDLDFSWTLDEVQQAITMWRQGASLPDMADVLHRDGDEVAVLVMDLVRRQRIRRREGGWMGGVR